MSSELSIPRPSYDTLRRWPRYKLDLPLRLVVSKGDKTAIVQGRGNELNEGGMAIFAGVELKIDEEVAVEFTPPYHGGPIRVRCTVKNRNGYTYGVEFKMEDEVDFDSAAQLRQILRGMGIPMK